MVDDNITAEGNEDKIAAMAEKAAAKIRATRLSEIACVPPEKRDAFCKHVAEILLTARLTTVTRAQNRADVFEQVERAANELHNAVLALTNEQFNFLQGRIIAHTLWANERMGQDFAPFRLATLPLFALACSDIVGKNPLRRGREGNIRDWEFRRFIWTLWECAREHGGDLNASKRENKYFGAMFKAVHILRDLWGEQLSKDDPPLFRPGQEQSIVNIVANAKKGVPPGTQNNAD
jgi:hypothetical protein